VLDDSDDAQRWLDEIDGGGVEGFAPDLIYAEVAQGLVKHVRAQRVTPDQADRTMRAVAQYPIVTTSSRLLAGPACALALELGLTAYDAHYLALAEAEDAVLVTADRRLAEAASRSVLLD
jgi:predicted nucleic acid-binding protein